jgi:ribonuclease HII
MRVAFSSDPHNFDMLDHVQCIIGVDEAGRGALAGPVCVGVVSYPPGVQWEDIFGLITKRGAPKLRDSKKLSAQQRTILFERIVQHPRLRHAIALVDAVTIDAIGIVPATHEAVACALTSLNQVPETQKVLLDAGLRAPSIWEQESFVRGDETIPAISLASIVAKVTRDRFMEELSGTHPLYGFDAHKGYGTAGHRSAIRRHGLLPGIHRITFCASLY